MTRPSRRPSPSRRGTRLLLERLEAREVPAAFQPGNVVVYRIGDGAAALSNAGNEVWLDEINPTNGTVVQSVRAWNTAQNDLVGDGFNLEGGSLSLSQDGVFLTYAGYSRSSPNNVNVTATTTGGATPTLRVVGRASYTGHVDTRTATTLYDTDAVYGAVTSNGSTFWVAGEGNALRSGIIGGTSLVLTSGTPSDLKAPTIFGGQLYVSNAAGGATRIGSVGSGTPTSGATISALPGLPAGLDANAYYFADLSNSVGGFDTLYVAAVGDGIRKYSLNGGTWTLKNSVGTGLAISSLSGRVLPSGVIEIVAVGEAATDADGGGKLYSLQDGTGYDASISATPALFYTTSTNTSLRGVSHTPSRPNAVFVDDDWAGTTIGLRPGSDPNSAANGLVFGTNAFATIDEALQVVSTGGSVTVYGGRYDDAFTVSRDVVWTGRVNTAAPGDTEIVIGGAVRLGVDTTFNLVNVDMKFLPAGTINALAAGGASLTLASSGRRFQLEGAVGQTAALTSLTTDAGGRTIVSDTTIRTVGPQSYNDSFELFGTGDLRGERITMERGLTMLSDGRLAFNISGTNPLDLLVVRGQNVAMGDYNLTVESAGVSVGRIETPMTGIAGFGKDGPGTVILTGNSTYSGLTTVEEGTLQVGTGGTTGKIGSDDVDNDAVLIFDRSDTVAIDNSFDGVGEMYFRGSGTFNLSGSSPFTGDTFAEAAVVVVNGSLAESPVEVQGTSILAGPGSVGPVTVVSGGTAELRPGPFAVTTPGTMNVFGDLDIDGRLRIDFQDALTIDKVVVNPAGTTDSLVSLDAGNSFLVINYTGSTGGLGSQAGQYYVLIENDGTADATVGAFSSIVVNGIDYGAATTFLIDNIEFTLYYNGGDGNDVVLVPTPDTSTTYADDDWAALTPGTVVIDADPVTAGDQTGIIGYNAFPTVSAALAAALPGGVIWVNDGTYAGDGVGLADGKKIVLLGTAPNQAGTVTVGAFSGVAGTSVDLNYNALSNTLASSSSTTETFAGSLFLSNAGFGGGNFSRSGTGVLTLTGSNTYTGTTTIGTGATLVLGGGGTTGSVAGGPVVNAGTLVLNRSDAVSLPNIITGTGGLTKIAGGTATLSGLSSFSGPTAVNAGTLLVTGTTGSPTAVASGAVLGGTGSVGAVTAAAGSAVSPGTTGVGTLSATGSSTISGAFNVGVASATSADRFRVVGTPTISGATLNVAWLGAAGTFSPGNGAILTIVENDGTADPTVGTFAGLANQDDIVIDGIVFKIYYNAGDGNDVILAYLPPITDAYADDDWASLAIGAVVTDANPTIPGAQTVIIGSNGFSTVTAALNAIGANNTVFVLPGTYAETPDLLNGKKLSLVGESATTAGTVTLNGLDGAAGTEVDLDPGALNNFLRVGAGNTSSAFAGVISGAGLVEKIGTGTLTLTGANTFSDSLTVTAGTLEIGTGGTLGSGLVANNAALSFSGSDTVTVSNLISGTGTLTRSGSGTTILTGTNTYSGTTTISSGEIRVGGGGTTGTLGTGAVVNNASLVFDRSNSQTAANAISGVGTVANDGAGRTILTGTSTYTGATSVNDGELTVNGSIVSVASAVGSGTVLGGNGTIRLGSLPADTFLSPGGNGVGTLSVANGATIDGTLRMNFFSDTSYDTLAVTGAVTLNATAQLVGLPAAGPGSFNPSAASLFVLVANDGTDPVSGTFAGLAQGATVTVDGKDFTILYDGGDGNDVVLLFTPPVSAVYVDDAWSALAANTRIADVDPVAAGNQPGIVGYNAFSTVAAGLAALPSSGTLLVNDGSYAAEAVSLAGTQTLRLLGVNASTPGSVTLGSLAAAAGTSVDLGFAGLSNTLAVGGDNASTTIAGSVGGVGNLVKQGTGTLILSGSSAYTGTTTISGGTLQIGVGGSGGAFNTSSVTNNGSLVFNRSSSFTVTAPIGGSGSLTQAGTASVILTANNTYAGTTTVNAGAVLQIGSGLAAGTVGSGDIVSNGTFVVRRSDAYTLANAISGAGGISQAGTGQLTLTGNNTYTGLTAIGGSGGLKVGNGGSAGTLGTGPVSNSFVLTFDRSDAVALAGTVSGSGSIAKLNGGSLTLTGNNTYSGGTTVSGGTLFVGNGGTAGSLGTGPVVNNAAVVFNRSDALTVGAAISGSGSLTQAGTGRTVLTAANTYTGATTVAAGVLQVGSGSTTGTLGSGPVVTNGLLAFNRGDDVTVSANISGSGGVAQLSNKRLTLTGTNSFTGISRVDNGTLVLGSVGALAPGASVVLGKDNTGLPGVLDLGGYDVLLGGLATGANNIAGANNRVINSSSAPVTLTVDDADDATFAGRITSANLSFVKDGVGKLTLAGASDFGGTASVLGGTLDVTGSLTASVDVLGGGLSGDGSSATVNTSVGTAFAPGNPAGVYDVAGDLNLGGDLLVSVDAAGNFAGVKLAGGGANLDVNSTLTLTYLGTAGTFNPASGQIVKLIDNDGTDPVNGTFGNVANGDTVTIDGKPFLLFYNSGDGNDVILLSISTPTAVYADDDWAALSPGTFVTDADPVAPGDQTAVIGFNAFAEVADAVNAVTAVGTVYVNAGTYATDAALSGQTLSLLGSATIGSLSGSSAAAVHLAANALTVTEAGVAAFDGVISGTGSLTKAGAGTLALTADNTFTGTTTVAAGTLQLGDNTSTGSVGGPIVNDGDLVFSRTGAAAFAAVISGTGALTQAGTGSLTLSAANTYTGGTNVASGTLLVTGSLASAVFVDSGATLGGTGAVAGISGVAGSAVAPGASVGTLTSTGGVDADSDFAFEFDATGNDTLAVTGAVDISGAATFSWLGTAGTFAPAGGTVFTLIANDGTDPVVGTFAGLPNGATVTIDSQPFAIYYNSGDGNDVILLSTNTPTTVYVDDDFAALTPGTAIADADPVAPGNQLAVAGFNAFGTIGQGVAVAAFGGTVKVNAGTYAENVVLTGVTLDGNAATAGEVVIDPASGTGVAVTGNGVTVRDLTVTGGAAGLTASAVSGLTLENLALTGNTGAGLTLSDIGGTLNVTGLTLTGNGSGGSIANAPTLNLTGSVGAIDDVFTVSGTSLQHTRAGVANQALTLAAIANLNIAGDLGNDAFNVTPAAGTAFGISAASAGDVLRLAFAGTTTPTLSAAASADGYNGSATFGNRAAVSFTGVNSFPNVQFAVTSVPSTVRSGVGFAATVTVRDTVTGAAIRYNGPVTLGVNTGPGTLSGTTTATAVNGVATFGGVSLNRAGRHTLRATAPGFTAGGSAAINVTASSIGFVTVPTSVRSNKPGLAGYAGFTVQVAAKDAAGFVATNYNGPITISLVSGPIGVGGTLTATAVNGVATFSTLFLRRAGNYVLRAAASGFTAVASPTIKATANRLIVTGPTSTAFLFNLRFTLTAVDADGYLATNFAGPVTMTATGPTPLAGTVTVTAAGGRASWSDLEVFDDGTYRFQAKGPGLNSPFVTVFFPPTARGRRA